MNGAPGQPPMDLVKDYWTTAFAGKSTQAWTLRNGTGQPFANADTFWRHALHDGFIASTSRCSPRPGAPAPGGARLAAARRLAAGPATGLEIVFRPDPHILDGRFANNGWLQELPKPLSKLTWDNVAYLSAQDRRAASASRTKTSST